MIHFYITQAIFDRVWNQPKSLQVYFCTLLYWYHQQLYGTNSKEWLIIHTIFVNFREHLQTDFCTLNGIATLSSDLPLLISVTL